MKKISFGLLIAGLALPILSLAQYYDYSSASGREVQATDTKMEAVSPEKMAPSASPDIYKLISPMAPTIAPIAPVINKIIDTTQKREKPSASGSGTFDSGDKVKVLPNTSPSAYSAVPKSAFPACYIGDDLMKQYDSLISDLQDAQNANDSAKADLITQKIIELKQTISASKTNCGVGSATSVIKPQSSTAPQVKQGMISSGAIQMGKCEEVSRWEDKIAYYTKLSNLTDTDLQNQTNLSRDEIKNILASLADGLQNVKQQCSVQSSATSTSEAAQTAGEPIKPVGVQSVQEIQDYYKAKIENITATQNVADQVRQLKDLKNSKDQLVGDLIKNRKEVRASDINAVAGKIDVNGNEMKIDNTAVGARGAKIIVNIGNSSVSVEAAGNNVLIKDKNFDVTADEVSISSSSLEIGGVKIDLAASQVAEKLNIKPSSAELTTENSQPVYKLKIAEPRKLFGFIKMDVQNTQTADANNGNLLSESRPWYYFLTTK